MTFATDLATRALSIHIDTVPPEAIHIARRAFADTVGVALAALDAPYLATLEDVLDASLSAKQATLWGRGGRKTSVLHAALINGTAAHALDFDDCSTTMGGHPSAPIVPVVLALAEHQAATAGEAIEAYLTGVEVCTRMARGLLPHHYEKGWHPTATLGVFGATAAAARMMKFDEHQMATALCVAVSMASGLKSNFGTPVKPLHVGQAAHNAVMAALLVSRGMDANLSAFEHTYGFFNLFNGEGTYDAEAILADWQGEMEVLNPGIAIKQHPCCGSAHSAIDAALKLVAEHGLFDPDNIVAIETETHTRRLAHTNRPEPRTGLDAKFSVQFLTAKALVDGHIRLNDFDDDTFLTPVLSRLLPKVSSAAHDDANAYLGRVKLTLRDGPILQAEAETRFGRGPGNPMSDAELFGKFSDCTAQALPGERARKTFAAFMALQPHDSMNAVFGMIGGE
ncbi:MmgE/PrpD family protein [Pseudotabrizicola alkalilacus]|uniref:MmgE/PrpD family protein n=1 Tax=Pseudotabrizicola alkalilacus TaxID=2305252 RepID=A0A411YXD0_9RHOB|nr:MmgE/PrpD family protein [Pseudotabrizicola alkalilacus]RGP35389.1 MmgE/PrpD family protein [Pseudotabrizicola alkalilacus]